MSAGGAPVVVFVIAQDRGHFGYTTHLAQALHGAGYGVEYWSHQSAAAQCPPFASFHWLSDDQRFTSFYCREASRLDSDALNLRRMAATINDLAAAEFGPLTDPMAASEGACAGHPDRVRALKRRLLRPDVALCVNDCCHVFSWAGAHAERCQVPTLNLYPSQHEIQRRNAGVLDDFNSIFNNLATPSSWQPSPEPDYEPVRTGQLPPPPSLYITYAPLITDPALVPPGREVIGPVYMPADLAQQQQEELRDSELDEWLRADPRPVVFLSLGSMVQGWDFTRDCLQCLFGGLCGERGRSAWRVLTTVAESFARELLGDQCWDNVYFAGWVPQFAVLADPVVKVFVSHCGANSVHESLFHGVPIVALPFFDDQRYNGRRLLELGLASACLSKENGKISQMEVEKAVMDAIENVNGIRETVSHASEELRLNPGRGLDRLLAAAKLMIYAGERV
ncbi:unnamed protein product, partial [Ectocarpus fasciculatus]